MSIRDLAGAFSRPEVSHFLEVVDEKSTTFRAENIFKIRAQISCRFFYRQYIWTGSGSVDEQPPELICRYDDWGFPLHKLHGPVIVEQQSRILLVDLGHTFAKGEHDEVHFIHRLKDLNGTFKPYLGSTSKSPTKRIKLEVGLPTALANDVRFCEVATDTDTVLVSESLVGTRRGEKMHFTRSVTNPMEGTRDYRIVWGR